MIFLFLRWDMLISRRVDGRPHEKAEKMCQFYPLDMLVMCIFPFLKNQWSWNEDFKKVFQVSRLSVSFLPFLWVSTCVPAAVPIYVSNYPSRFPGPFPSLFKKNPCLSSCFSAHFFQQWPVHHWLLLLYFMEVILPSWILGVTNQISHELQRIPVMKPTHPFSCHIRSWGFLSNFSSFWATKKKRHPFFLKSRGF